MSNRMMGNNEAISPQKETIKGRLMRVRVSALAAGRGGDDVLSLTHTHAQKHALRLPVFVCPEGFVYSFVLAIKVRHSRTSVSGDTD